MKFTILYYDDEQELLFITKKILEGKGHSVYCYTNTEHVFTDIENNKPDVLLLDLNILPEGGAAVVSKLKSSLAYRHIPVILVSGDAYIAEISKTCGANGFLEKPFTTTGLLNIIQLVTGAASAVETARPL